MYFIFIVWIYSSTTLYDYARNIKCNCYLNSGQLVLSKVHKVPVGAWLCSTFYVWRSCYPDSSSYCDKAQLLTPLTAKTKVAFWWGRKSLEKQLVPYDNQSSNFLCNSLLKDPAFRVFCSFFGVKKGNQKSSAHLLLLKNALRLATISAFSGSHKGTLRNGSTFKAMLTLILSSINHENPSKISFLKCLNFSLGMKKTKWTVFETHVDITFT